MQDHIRDLLHRFQYSEQLKETAAFRILIGGEDLRHVMADLDIHNSYTLLWLGESVATQDPDGLVRCAYHDTHPETGCPSVATAQSGVDAVVAGS